jgi:hypothetical protein
MRFLRHAGLTLLAALLLAGCGGTAAAPAKPSSTPSPTPKLEAGWKVYPVSSEGFAVAIPPNWGHIDLTLTGADISAAFPDYPQAATFFKQVQVNKYIKFFAVDHQSLATGYATNLNVIRVPLDDTVTSLDQVVAAELDTFQKQLKLNPTHRRVHLTAGEAEEFDTNVTVTAGDGTKIPTAIKQYMMLRLGSQEAEYVLSMTSRASQADAYAPTFLKIANAFQYR